MARLIVTDGPFRGQSFDVADAATIGRSPDCEVHLDDQGVSRKHARVTSTSDGFTIEDLGSSNGTTVNGQPVLAPTPLRDGDVVQVYKHALKFSAGRVGQGSSAAGASGEPVVRVAEPADVSVRAGGAVGPATIDGTFDMGATMVGGVFTPSLSGDVARANERLRSIIRISSAIQTELDLGVLLDLVIDNLFQVLRLADNAFLMLYDEAGELKPAASRNRQGQAQEVRVSRNIINEAVGNRMAILSSDAATDGRFSGAMSIADFNIRSMMCAPLIAKDDVLGIIHVDTTRPGSRFTQDDLELLSGAAAQTALAIASARMHEKLLVRDRMERDMKVATQVQTSFLPASTPAVPGLAFAAYYKAALDIGGDLYDFIPLSGGSMAVVVGDVSGKGVPAALMMARMSSDVRFYSVQESDPKDVLPHLSRRMDETGMSDVFVTMLLARLDLETHEAVIANAAHCMPLIRRAAEGDVITVGDRPGPALGMMPDFPYEQATYALRSGDVVCFVTDGVTEAMDADKRQYGEKRLIEAIAAAPASAQGVLDAVLSDVAQHVGDTYQSDDLTCVCFGVSAEDAEEVLTLEFFDEE